MPPLLWRRNNTATRGRLLICVTLEGRGWPCGGRSSVAERLTVAQEVAGSIPVAHPIFTSAFEADLQLFPTATDEVAVGDFGGQSCLKKWRVRW